MARTPKQLENLKKGEKTRFRAGEEQVKIARMGGKASGEARNWKSTMNKCMGEHWDAPVDDDRVKAKLKKAHLPQTYFGQMLFNAGQSAGRNPAMLRTILEAMDVLNGQQTNVTVNNGNPYADLSDEALKRMAEED